MNMYIHILDHRKHLHVDEITVKCFDISSQKVYFTIKTSDTTFPKV